MVAYFEELETYRKSTHKDSMRKRWYLLNAKEVIFPKRRIYFSNRRCTNQKSWRRSGEHPRWCGSTQFEESQSDFSWRTRRVSSTFSRLISGCRWSDKWFLVHVRKVQKPTSRWTSNFRCRERNHSLFHWNTLTSPELHIRIWMPSKKNASMIIGISMVTRFVRSLDRFHTISIYWKKNLHTDICGPGREYQENSWHPGQIAYGKNSGSQWESTWSWRRSKSGRMKKIHLENARKLRWIYYIDPQDEEFKEIIKNVCKKLETSVAPARLWKIMKRNFGSGGSNKIKTRLACILEADESTRLRMGNSLPKHHEDHIAGEGFRFTNLFLCLKLWKFLQQKQQWTRNGKNWRKFRRGTWRKSKVRKRWSMK